MKKKNHKYTFNIFIRHTKFRNPPTTRMTIDIFSPSTNIFFSAEKVRFFQRDNDKGG